MIEGLTNGSGSGSRGLKTYGSDGYGSGFGSGSATLYTAKIRLGFLKTVFMKLFRKPAMILKIIPKATYDIYEYILADISGIQ